ncbi:MAG TPA: hypothetical protein VKR59_11585 [Terriglobales bacterium]|nr:hypothetical protein [Terriglobales bacterium]
MGSAFRVVRAAVRTNARATALSAAVLCLALSTLCAQETAADPGSPQRIPVMQDWSTRRVIFTRNGSEEDMLKVRDNPRFMHSTLLRYLREHDKQAQRFSAPSSPFTPNSPFATSNSLNNELLNNGSLRTVDGDAGFVKVTPDLFSFRRRNKNSNVDWSISLGPNSGMAMGETPAIYTYNYTSPSCSNLSATPATVGDFAVYTINATPTTTAPGQANLVGITNLYTTGDGSGFCAGTGPEFLFSYAIGTGGSPLSPVVSADGSRIAWIETASSGDAILHVTIWGAKEGATATSPITPVSGFTSGQCATAGTSCDFALDYTNATYTGCTTAHATKNTHSELYVDYSSNTGFISANNGLLYHIKNMFSTTTNPSVDFCIPVNTTFETANKPAMSGPLYDETNSEVFITDSEKVYAFTVGATSFTAASPASYTYGNASSTYTYVTGPGPILDPFNGYLYLFSTYDAASNTSVTQLPVALTAGSGTVVQLGAKSTNTNKILFDGAFDNNYYTFGPKNSASTMYTCGTDSTATTQGLFSISFNASTGAMNTTPTMSDNKNVNPGAAANGVCSPITEYYDGTTDRIFVGMGQPAATTGANVVTMWDVTSRLTNTSGVGGTMPTYTAQAVNYYGGSSGIAADNIASSTAQAESIYFSTESTPSASTVTPVTTTTPYNLTGIYTDGTKFSATGGLDGAGSAYSATALGTSVTWNGYTFTVGPANNPDVWTNTTITLPSGKFSTLIILATAVDVTSTGIVESFAVNYTDGTSTTLSQNFSDWFNPLGFNGESIAKTMAYRNTSAGTKDNRTFDVYGYAFAINPNKTVSTLTLPATTDVTFLAAALATNCGGADYCAIKLTQSGLQ